jgi:hypothetical protein
VGNGWKPAAGCTTLALGFPAICRELQCKGSRTSLSNWTASTVSAPDSGVSLIDADLRDLQLYCAYIVVARHNRYSHTVRYRQIDLLVREGTTDDTDGTCELMKWNERSVDYPQTTSTSTGYVSKRVPNQTVVVANPIYRTGPVPVDVVCG